MKVCHLQKTILQKFQEENPKLTLKDISDKTGINISRVFRLLNGYEMKLSEYEKFENAILLNSKVSMKSDLYKVVDQCYEKLSTGKIDNLLADMQLSLLSVNHNPFTLIGA